MDPTSQLDPKDDAASLWGEPALWLPRLWWMKHITHYSSCVIVPKPICCNVQVVTYFRRESAYFPELPFHCALCGVCALLLEKRCETWQLNDAGFHDYSRAVWGWALDRCTSSSCGQSNEEWLLNDIWSLLWVIQAQLVLDFCHKFCDRHWQLIPFVDGCLEAFRSVFRFSEVY